MSSISIAVALLGGLLIMCAWREYGNENRRDAKLLAACGTGGILAGAALWLV